MNEDIVTRLREHSNGYYTAEYMMRLAADEIERLRTKLDQTEQQLEYERSMEFD